MHARRWNCNQSVYKVNEANKKLIVSTRNMENAEENLRHANLGFEEGVIPALNLMQAQTAWVSARSCLIDAQIEVKLTEVYLTKAMGKLGEEPGTRIKWMNTDLILLRTLSKSYNHKSQIINS